MPFNEILETEFTSFTVGVKPNYVLIEEALIDIGGNGVKGVDFKMQVLNTAGWNYGKLISYGAHPDTATAVFNKIRIVLNQTNSKDELLQKLHWL